MNAPITCAICREPLLNLCCVSEKCRKRIQALSLLPTRTEQVRDCIAKEADRLAAVLSEDSRIVVELRVQVRELNEIARLQREVAQ